MESNELNLNSSNFRPQPRITNQSGHNSGSPSPMVAQILAATQSIIAMDLTPPPSLFSYSLDISFGRHSNTTPIISEQHIQQQVLKKIEELNKNPDVLYMSELRQRPEAEQINANLTKIVKEYGFERPENGVEYVYTGSDPAGALRNLLDIKPLVLDCGTALSLLTYQALLKTLGSVAFNTYIKEACDGTLSINKQTPPRLPANRTVYYSARHEQNENPLPKALKRGDHLWIQGPADGDAFHPASEINAFNVVVDINGSGQPKLVGFDYATSPTHGRWSYTELRNLLLKSYNSPLTLGDIYILKSESGKNTQEKALYSSLTYADAYAWLSKNQPAELADALRLLDNKNVNFDQPTKLYPPKSQSIRGVVKHDSTQDSLSFDKLINDGDNLSTIARNPVIPPNKQFSDLIPGFKTDLPHQQQIHAAIDDFYHRCVDKNGQKKEGQNFDGLILYGNSGTGKTMACKALVDQLKKKKHVIWKTDFSGGESLLSTKEQTQLLSLRQTKGTKAYYAALTEKFKAVWKRADIIFIDDTNKPYGVLANISKVAIDYAREMGKKILITCNSDPICAFHSHIKYPIDAIVIRHITGSDYREGNAWYQGVEPI
ncbi:ATP-binding protein [Candidatus Regiella endosymbiont of Tuberolachnus salignus]|uniref:ATP-binding protein n=1 Tax=Candidatus Regiella endosymbiont of Tuberolachnus salignus TaxID=3077956 RepID=UPI0030CDB1DC